MVAGKPNPSESRIELEVRRVQALIERRQFLPALTAAEAMLAQVPENRDVLYLVAVSQRYLGRITDALRTLARFEGMHPDFARLYQERGHCFRAVGETTAAIESYTRAATLNPSLPASWQALAEMCGKVGMSAQAESAARQVAHLAKMARPVVTAAGMFAEGNIDGAERLVRQYLHRHNDDIEAMRLLAQIGMKLDILDDAEFLFESVLAFAPDYHVARYEYAVVLSQRHKYAQALEEVQKLLRTDPQNRAFKTLYATSCVGFGHHDEALRVFRELLTHGPQQPDLHLSIAHVLKTLGRQQQAIESYRAAAAARPSFGDAYWSLANLKTYRFSDGEIGRMRAHEAASGTSLVDRYHLCFALGKALEDRADYAESFTYYERGNASKRREISYSAESLERSLGLQRAVFTSDFIASRHGAGCNRPDPIFIVGLPRAGSTLLEQILASHSLVEGTTELADIPRLVQRLAGRGQKTSAPRYPAVLTELDAEQLRRLGQKYIDDTQLFRTGKPFFIDKMPNNFRHIGLIHLILPNAKIIDARREPMACCFSNFKQLFASGQEFTYSLDDIGRYYRSYVELMQHWDAVLPGKVLRVQHEEVVGDLERNVRRILDFCGLEFESSCIEFYRTERAVRTASSEQVRLPIFSAGLDQWRHFKRHLGPLETALGQEGRPQNAAPHPLMASP
jgi:tetratricopeptide (TPR) repeat protein